MIGAAAGAVLLLALTGCAGQAPTKAPAASASEEAPAETVEPLKATPQDEPAADGTPEEQYLASVREVLDPETTQIPDATDEQLLAAGADACEQIADGTLPDKVRVIEGEQPDDAAYYVDSMIIGGAASKTLCAN